MTRLVRWISLVALLGAMLIATSETARAADPFEGKWQLNVSNSMYDPGPAPKSLMRTHESVGDGIKVTLDFVDAEGKPYTVQYTATFDGSDHPMTGAANADTIALKRIDERTYEFTQKKTGKTTMTGKVQVSEDGSELTASTKGTDAKGEEFVNLMIYDKR
jgi:hypothetical protein